MANTSEWALHLIQRVTPPGRCCFCVAAGLQSSSLVGAAAQQGWVVSRLCPDARVQTLPLLDAVWWGSSMVSAAWPGSGSWALMSSTALPQITQHFDTRADGKCEACKAVCVVYPSCPARTHLF